MLDFLYDAFGVAHLLNSLDRQKEQCTSSTIEKRIEETKPKKFAFRPRTLDEYIGQDQAKELVNLTIKKIIDIKPTHILISGSAGHGKTTLANIIGNQLSFSVSYFIAGTFTLDHLHKFLLENETGISPRILFLDEIHNLEKEIAEYMYPIIEDFKLNNEDIRPFILIGATTEKYTLLKKYKPFVDRCACQIQLTDYTVDDMQKILTQYNAQIYNEKIDTNIMNLLARNCRFTPRIGISLLDDYVVCKNINQVLSSRRIIYDSLTDTDIAILAHLKEINAPVGEETLSIISGIERADYKTLVEPFLLRQGYMSRKSKGRVVTQKGIQILQEIK